jgi:chemotaxis signal transduction protein
MLNLHGEPTPVYDTRRLLGLATRPLQPRDRLLLTRNGGGRQAFAVDDVLGTLECDQLREPGSFSARAAGVRGIIAGHDGIVFVHNLDQFLHLERAIRVDVHA